MDTEYGTIENKINRWTLLERPRLATFTDNNGGRRYQAKARCESKAGTHLPAIVTLTMSEAEGLANGGGFLAGARFEGPRPLARAR